MAYNKFKLRNGTVLLDLTEDTIAPETLEKGITAHDRSGNPITGALEHKLQEKTIAENGEVVADESYYGLSKVVVAIPTTQLNLQEKTTTENGEIIADDGYDGLSKVVVAVPAPRLQGKEILPLTEEQVVTADEGNDGLSSVTVKAIQTEEKAAEINGEVIPTDGKYLSKVIVNVQPVLQDKVITPTKASQEISADNSYYGLSSVTVNPIPDEYIIPADTTRLTGNGTYDVAAFAKATVDVQPDLQNKTVTPTKASQSITASSGYYGLKRVTVEPIPDTFMEVPTDSISITYNGTHNILNYANATVNVQPLLQEKTVTTSSVVTADSGYYGLSKVTVDIDTPVFNIAYGGTAPTDTSKLWIKLTKSETIPVIIVTPAGTTQQHLNTLVIEADVSKNTFQLLPNIELGVNSVYFENADGDRTEISAALYKNNEWIEI